MDDMTSGKPNWTTSSNQIKKLWFGESLEFFKENLDRNFNPELLKGTWTAHAAVVADEPVTSFYPLTEQCNHSRQVLFACGTNNEKQTGWGQLIHL